MITENPDDANLKVSLKKFDAALSHPDEVDLENVKKFTKEVLKKPKIKEKNVLKGRFKF